MKTRHVNVRIAAIVMAVLMVALMVGIIKTQASSTVLVDNLAPSWTAPGGGGVFSAYVGPPAYGYVSPGTTALFDGREAGIIKAGLAIDPDGHYWDEGLFAFKPNITIDALAAGALSYDVQNSNGPNPVWMTIDIDTGVVGDRGDDTVYQHVPTTNPAGWHRVDAAAGLWQMWTDDAGTVTGSPMISLAQVASDNTGLNAVRVYLRLGMGDSYYNYGSGTIGWVDQVTISSITYDFVLPTYWYVDTTGSDSNEGTLASPFLTIQHAVDSAANGDTIHIDGGVYNEAVTVNKRLKIIGSGEAPPTVIRSTGGSGGVIQLAASGLPSDPIVLQNLRIEPTQKSGISVGQFTQATGTSVSNVELSDVTVMGTNTNPCSEQERGLYVDLTSSLTNLNVINSVFNNLAYGWYFHKQVSADTSTVQNVWVYNTIISHNNLKGIYAEKLEDATFRGVSIAMNGYDANPLMPVLPSYPGCPYFAPWMSGVDINLKAGDYQNITFDNGSWITLNGLGGAKEGVGVTFKARDDGGYAAFPASLTNVLISGSRVSGNERGIRIGEPGKNNAGPTGVVVSNTCIYDNVKTYVPMDGSAYGGLVDMSLAPVLAENNWWGAASGPTNPGNPTGTGDAVYGPVDFAPWLNACGGSPVANFQNVSTGELFASLQAAVDDADTVSGHTLAPLTVGPWPGTTTVTKPGLIIKLNGATFTGSSSAFVISAPNTTITGPGLLDGWTGANNLSPAIEVLTGGDNLILDGVEIKRWDYGMIVQAPVESLKVVNNWIHTNTNIGLFVAAAPTGVVTIEGNLFKVNGGAGVGYGGAGMLKARYNSWGDDAGPTGTYGDGVTSGVDYTPWGFAEFYIDVDPTVPGDDTIRTVSEGTTFDVDLIGDAENLYGLSFKFTYDNAKLTLNGGSPTFAAPWTGTCVNPPPGAPPTGTVAFVCKLTSGPEWDGGVIATFNFTATGAGLVDPSPWVAYFDISHLETNTSAGALGGVKVWMNNAGYNAPTIAARDITDTDDGKITIDGLAAFTGFVDLEGRPNDSGALLKVFNDNLGTTLLAQATSASSGKYTTSPVLVTMTNYFLYVDRPLFLPTVAYWSKLLDTRPLTTLAQLLLLGGDATDDNLIDIGDATCIGNAYGVGPSLCGGVGSSDVNGDGVINILDLTLMGGNYTKNVSPWTP